MFKIISLLSLLCLSLFSKTLEINYENELYNTSSNQKTYEDKNHEYDELSILNNTIKENYFKNTSTYSKSIFWTKIHIKNSDKKDYLSIFRNNRAGIDNIEIFIFDKNKNFIKSAYLGDLRNQKDRVFLANKSIFYLTLKPQEEYYIITKFQSLGSLDLHWDILSVQNYTYISTIEYIFWGLFAGVIIALIFYNLMMFLTLKDKVYLYYVLHAFFLLYFSYSINGLLYLFDIGINLYFITISTWFSPALMLIFLNLFAKNFFKITKEYRLLNNLFTTFISLNFIIFLIFIFALYDTKVLSITPVFLIIILLNILFIAFVAIWSTKKKLEGSIFFLIGETIYLSSLIFTILFTLGVIETTYLNQFILPLCLLLEVSFLAIALSYKISKIKKDNDKKEFLLSQEKSIFDIGKTVKNLSHQFRQPLSYISSQILYLETLYNLNKKNQIADEFISIKDKLNYSIDCMSQTLSLFNNFYNESNEIIIINPSLELKKLIDIHKEKLILNNISFTINCDDNLNIKTYKGYFSNVMTIFLDNSLESFEINKIENPTINISISRDKDKIIILFEDNGEGIKKENLNKIFEPHYTTKKGKYGLGLSIAKVMIEEKLNSKIIVKNENNKTIFIIELIDLNNFQ